MYIFTDIFRSILCCCQPLQETTYLHRQSHRTLQRKEAPWSATSCICHHRFSIQKHVARWVFCLVCIYKKCILDIRLSTYWEIQHWILGINLKHSPTCLQLSMILFNWYSTCDISVGKQHKFFVNIRMSILVFSLHRFRKKTQKAEVPGSAMNTDFKDVWATYYYNMLK